MKRKRHLFIGLVFGMVIGWVLGFLRLPYLEKNTSFLLGFTAALTIVSLVLLLLTSWNRGFLLGLIGKKTETGDFKSTRANTLIWIILIGIPVLGGIVRGLTFYRHNEDFKLQIQRQGKQMEEMAALIRTGNNNNLAPLMRSVLDDVRAELKRNPGRTLRNTTTDRIAALSLSFKPYKYFEHDSLSDKVCSPERGQLLQALVLMNIDTGTFARIKRNTLFAGADLRQTDLKGVDLSGINLREANLKDADLSGANLKGADLGKANLWGANLNRANLCDADLKRADLSWAKLNAASLIRTNLNGAILINTQLMKADLNGANVQWAQSDGALFNEASLTRVNFTGTQLTKVNLSQANLSGTDLRKTNLSQAVLVGVRLSNVLVDENWQKKLMEWQPLGVKELQKNYTVVNDTFDKGKRPLYRLRKN